jgi:hypothetical protein
MRKGATVDSICCDAHEANEYSRGTSVVNIGCDLGSITVGSRLSDRSRTVVADRPRTADMAQQVILTVGFILIQCPVWRRASVPQKLSRYSAIAGAETSEVITAPRFSHTSYCWASGAPHFIRMFSEGTPTGIASTHATRANVAAIQAGYPSGTPAGVAAPGLVLMASRSDFRSSR